MVKEGSMGSEKNSGCKPRIKQDFFTVHRVVQEWKILRVCNGETIISL